MKQWQQRSIPKCPLRSREKSLNTFLAVCDHHHRPPLPPPPPPLPMSQATSMNAPPTPTINNYSSNYNTSTNYNINHNINNNPYSDCNDDGSEIHDGSNSIDYISVESGHHSQSNNSFNTANTSNVSNKLSALNTSNSCLLFKSLLYKHCDSLTHP